MSGAVAQNAKTKSFPVRKRLENEVPGLQKAPRERQETARSAPGAPSVPPGASKSRQERHGSAAGREAPFGPPRSVWRASGTGGRPGLRLKKHENRVKTRNNSKILGFTS